MTLARPALLAAALALGLTACQPAATSAGDAFFVMTNERDPRLFDVSRYDAEGYGRMLAFLDRYLRGDAPAAPEAPDAPEADG